MISEIYIFNTELLGIETGKPKLLEKPEMDWLLVALNEEIQELVEAHEKKSVVNSIDAVLDLAYFAVGACVRMGLTQTQIEDCFAAINNANMRKKQGIKDTRPTDGSIADAVKPEDWEPPEEAMRKIIYSQLELDL